MYHNVKKYVLLSLSGGSLALAGGAAHAISLSQFDLQLNNIGVAVDNRNMPQPRLFVSLGKGFSKAQAFNPVLKYKKLSNYIIECGGIKLKSGATCRFNLVKYGDTSQLIRLYQGEKLVSTYNVIFTNLPVIEVTSVSPIVDIPKVRGTFRLMSGEFNQDTKVLPMGIEFAGQTSQNYKEKPLGIQLGTSTVEWNVAQKQALLDFTPRDDWRLDPAYRDATKVRNMVVQDLYRAITPTDPNRPKASASIKGHLTELIVNGAYQGVHVLEEKVDRTLLDLKKVNVPNDASGKPDWQAVDFSKPENFSVLYKADYEDWNSSVVDPTAPIDIGAAGHVPTSHLFFDYLPGEIESNFSIAYPKSTATPNYAPLTALFDFVITADDATFSRDIGRMIDLKSVANWWLLVQLTQGNDNTGKNFFIARNAGPTPADSKFFIVSWDGDATFGMLWNGKKEMISTYFAPDTNNLIKRLLENPSTGFGKLLKTQWNTFRTGANAPFSDVTILARFADYNTLLTRGGAKQRDADKWPKPDSAGVGDPKLATQRYLSTFLSIRLPAMDQYINHL